jgi:hypothetical protein
MNEQSDENRLFDDLFRTYELYIDVQIRTETSYSTRTNLILVAHGLLLVALPAILQSKISLFAQVLARLGTWLSAVWWVLEQRHLIHYESRESGILRPLEVQLAELAVRTGRGFRPLGVNAAEWVALHARSYQQHSTRTIVRNYAPLTFAICWSVILSYLLTHNVS